MIIKSGLKFIVMDWEDLLLFFLNKYKDDEKEKYLYIYLYVGMNGI